MEKAFDMNQQPSGQKSVSVKYLVEEDFLICDSTPTSILSFNTKILGSFSVCELN